MTRPHQLPAMEGFAPGAHGSDAPSRANKLHKAEHRRWNSDPEKKIAQIKPFAYEYKFEDGRLAGLAEYHPDDYMHYSSSRNPSTAASRNQSSRTSREDMRSRSSNDNRKSSSSTQTSNTYQTPPPSPGRIDGLKRALTLHSLKRRASTEVKKTPPPSPYSPRPEIERLAASFGRNGPQHITSPIPSLPKPKPVGMFEHPRTAPQPPSKDGESRHVAAPKSYTTLHRKNSSHDGVLAVRTPSTSPRLPETSGFLVSRRSTKSVPAQKVADPLIEERPAPPLLRRKTSKFIEHIKKTEKNLAGPAEGRAEEIPPVPPMILRASELILPIQGAEELSSTEARPPRSPKSPTVRFASATPSPTAGAFQPGITSRAPTSIMKPTSPNADREILQTSTGLRRSATMKALPPIPTQVVRRSMSTRNPSSIVPSPITMDLCMAEVKPVAYQRIVAQGHARMVSC
ncbi:uncharacterized protein PV09_07269 [Verruconis gallopava]|uniref:Uncharacterized protein n=1 Tax=Verruconis gallopava TaxID=253628 RepID=A0A0D2A425_9PEZI|nr:uncharacterized protein PV09_07269 [Verruconis gallopava]KIW01225.1 hypothetical protein PV09_07269 [Verruconis gallopava]